MERWRRSAAPLVGWHPRLVETASATDRSSLTLGLRLVGGDTHMQHHADEVLPSDGERLPCASGHPVPEPHLVISRLELACLGPWNVEITTPLGPPLSRGAV